MDNVIADVAYLDQHRPSPPVLWLLSEQVHMFREVTEWTARLNESEHDPT